MKALKNFGVHDLRVVQMPDPTVRPGTALIRVRASGFAAPTSGTDHWPDGFYRRSRGGDVVAIGDGVAGLQVGDRRGQQCGGCGACPRAPRTFTLCHNRTGKDDVNDGFCEYVVALERNCLLLNPAVDYVAGCCCSTNGARPLRR
jgi:D-arabinose 1-dehydrogenase-like Zn-dependent alcohol dehydrogenase